MLIYGIIKNHQKRPSPTGHPKKTSPKGNVFFCEQSSQLQARLHVFFVVLRLQKCMLRVRKNVFQGCEGCVTAAIVTEL